MPYRRAMVGFHEGLAFAAQVALFVVLGLLVFPSELGAVAWEAIALTAVLIVAARPLAVLVSTPLMRFRWQERAFLSWAGLRRAVPIVLATFALSAKVPESKTIFNAGFFVVLLSALIQGATLERVSDLLGLRTERSPLYRPPIELGAVGRVGAEIVEHEVDLGDAVVGLHVRDTALPRDAIVMLIVRNGSGIRPEEARSSRPATASTSWSAPAHDDKSTTSSNASETARSIILRRSKGRGRAPRQAATGIKDSGGSLQTFSP